MSDLKSFEAQLDAEFNQYTQELVYFAENVAGQLMSEIIDANPYWSGKSKASWTASINGPVKRVHDVPKRANAISAESAKQISMRTLDAIKDFAMGQVIYITQGTDYIAYIEAGTHGNNAGFIASTITKYDGLGNFNVSY